MQLPFTVTLETPSRDEFGRLFRARRVWATTGKPIATGGANPVLFWAKPRCQMEIGATESEYWPVSSQPEAGR